VEAADEPDRGTLAPPRRAVTEPAGPPAARDTLRLAFLALGAAFFGLAVLDRVLAFLAGFSSLLLTIVLAGLLAFLIGPLVDGLVERLHIRRGLAIAAAYGLVVCGIALFVVAMAQVGVREATDLAGRVDEITASIETLAANLQGAIGIDRSTIDLAAVVGDVQRRTVPALIGGLADQTQVIAESVLTLFGSLFIIVVLSLYAVADPGTITGVIRRIVPNRHAETLALVERTVGHAFRGFLRAQLAMVLVQVGITLVLGLAFGIPYLFMLTVSTGLLMFIPFFGPPLALVPIVFVVLALRSDMALLVVPILVIAQTVLVNAIQPRLLRREVGLHPILVLVALLVGSQVAGPWGAIFSIPLFAIASLLVRYLIDARAVNEVDGIELDEVVAAIRAEHPEIEVEEATGMAADQAEAMVEAETIVRDAGDG
jgi:predicted PurR-regulated permease PerM